VDIRLAADDFLPVFDPRKLHQIRSAQFGGLPDAIVACVGGGSNAIGIWDSFVKEPKVRLIGVEAAGHGLRSGRHAATLTKGKPGVLHGSMSYLLYDADGQVQLPHSVSAGLDYPGVGPEHSYLKDLQRVEYFSVTDRQALSAFNLVSRLEGIIPALETSHALAWLTRNKHSFRKKGNVVVCLSGRGDKDMPIIALHRSKR